MSHRIGNHAEYVSLRVDGIAPVEVFEFSDGQLPGRGCRFVVDACESQKAAELSRKYSADHAAFAHAEDYSLAACAVEQIEGLKTIIDMGCSIDKLRDRRRTDCQYAAMQSCDVLESAPEIMGR